MQENFQKKYRFVLLTLQNFGISMEAMQLFAPEAPVS